jgi:colanic acid/amylovoran biosynthesis glycosyltransferase
MTASPLPYAHPQQEPPGGAVIAYIFTTFPKSTETFLQREVTGLRTHGVNLRLYSMWGGGGEFDGLPVTHFLKWKLVTLVAWLPWLVVCRPRVVGELIRGVCSRRAPSWLNFFENLLGLGFGLVHASHFRSLRPAHIHVVWGGGPATAAWLLWRLDGHAYSGAGHAYDLYQDGGDWWLKEKLTPALFIHTSTEMGRRTLLEKGLADEKIHVIRRGLNTLPALKPLRTPRSMVRLLCVARLVPKKGFDHQLRIYAALKTAGVAFEARIAGEGPLRDELTALARTLGVANEVVFLGHRPQLEIAEHLAWADVLLHTGVVAADGDRDGLPNVIPEAMSAGVLVVTSPAAATTEAISDGVTGRVAAPEAAEMWVTILRELRDDDTQAERLRVAARAWVEANFDALKNSGRLAALYAEVTSR